jgi:1-acyl-sn-glycerol-3-phosphate acyltransferase
VKAIRGLTLFLSQCITTPIFVFLMILAIPLGGKYVVRTAAIWCGLNVDIAALLGMRYHITWDSPLPKEPSVILAKHSSAWETFFLMKVFPRSAFVVKKELLTIPFFGWGLAMCEPIAIDRTSPREARNQVQSQGVARLQKGYWISIFPEGTRTPAGFRGRYASGGAAVALAAGAPVIAVAHDAGFFWGKSIFDKRGGTIQVRVSAPIWPLSEDESSTSLTHRAEEWIEAQIEQFGHAPAQSLKTKKVSESPSTVSADSGPL